jgi:hypothetical protein
MWTMIGLLTGGAQAGDVWLVLDDARRHVEVPAEWFVSGGSSATVDTAGGRVELGPEVAKLSRAPIGAARAWPLAEGTLSLVHRDVAATPASALRLALGSGLTMELELGTDGAATALGPIDASLESSGLDLHIDQQDLLEPLRRSPPRTLYTGADRKGRPVVVEVR